MKTLFYLLNFKIMQLLKCNLSGKSYQVKKVCKLNEMPKNVIFFDTIYLETKQNFPYSGSQNIYINNSGYFATPIKS